MTINYIKLPVKYVPVTYGDTSSIAVAEANSTAFQNTFDSLSAAGGGTAKVFAGTIVVSGSSTPSDGAIEMKDNVTLDGDGMGVTIIKLVDDYLDADDANKISGIIRTPSAEINSNIQIKNLTIDGNKFFQTNEISTLTESGGTATVTTAVAHNLTNGDKVYIGDVTPIGHEGFELVTVTGATTFTYATDGTGSGSANMTMVSPLEGTLFQVSSISVSSGLVTVTTGSSHNLVDNTIITMMGSSTREVNGQQVVTVTGATTFTYVADSVSDGSKVGQMSWSGLHDGFYCGVSPASTDEDVNLLLEAVEVKNCTQYNFDPHEQTRLMQFLRCVSHNANLDGFVADYMENVIYDSCTAYCNGRHGFNVTTSTNTFKLLSSTSYCNGWGDAGGHGVAVQKGNTTPLPMYNIIANNVIYQNHDEGILARICERLNITGNIIYENNRRGIRLRGATDCLVSGNTIMDNSRETNNGYDEIQLIQEDGSTPSAFNGVASNFIRSTAANKARYGVFEENDASDNNIISSNPIVLGGVTGTIAVNGASSKIFGNNGAA